MKVDLKDPVAIARMCADEGVALVKFDGKGQVTELVLAPVAFSMASDRRLAESTKDAGEDVTEDPSAPKSDGRRVLAKHRRAGAKLPTVGGKENPLRRQKEKEERENVERVNFQTVDDDLQYAHTEG